MKKTLLVLCVVSAIGLVGWLASKDVEAPIVQAPQAKSEEQLAQPVEELALEMPDEQLVEARVDAAAVARPHSACKFG